LLPKPQTILRGYPGYPPRLLQQHYGFTAEELDFIVNYDIKYRLGRDTESEEEA
jgi:hypothetical protein